VSLSEKTPLEEALSAFAWDEFDRESRKQLTLFNQRWETIEIR